MSHTYPIWGEDIEKSHIEEGKSGDAVGAIRETLRRAKTMHLLDRREAPRVLARFFLGVAQGLNAVRRAGGARDAQKYGRSCYARMVTVGLARERKGG